MLDVTPDLLSYVRANSGLSRKDAAALLYSRVRNWYAWEEGKTKMLPALFELFLVKTGQKALPQGVRRAGKFEQRDTPPGASVIKLGRNAAELTQAQAAMLVHVTPSAWQSWELNRAKMHPAIFELFMLKTGWTLEETDLQDTPSPLTPIEADTAELEVIIAAYPPDIVQAAQQLRLQYSDMDEAEFWFARCKDHTVSKAAWDYAGDRLWYAVRSYKS